MKKKIFINLKPNKEISSNGGGNFFVINLEKYLKENNFKVTYDLEENIDLIFIIDPRKNNAFNKKFGLEEILEYKKKNPNTILIYRVNENDIKREISIDIEPILVNTMKSVDYVVFVSEWLQKYFIDKYKLSIKSTSIINGCDIKHFYIKKKDEKFKNNKIRLVTHHHSSNYLKGFHIYNEIDKLLEKRKDIEFTFIGNYNEKYKPKNIKLLPSCSGKKLGDLLRNNDIYLTATQYEPGAMHYVEGLSCGLPVLYCVNGGGAHEVCKVAGEEYNDINSMLVKMDLIKKNYEKYLSNIDYEYLGSNRCCTNYLNLIIELLN
jgi:hypothetical protein